MPTITPEQLRRLFEPQQASAGDVLKHTRGAYQYAPKEAHLQVAYQYAMNDPKTREAFGQADEQQKKYLLGKLAQHVDNVRNEYKNLYRLTATSYGAKKIVEHGASFAGNSIGRGVLGAASKFSKLRLLNPWVLGSYYLLKTRSPKAALREGASAATKRFLPAGMEDMIPGQESRILKGSNEYIPIRAAKRFMKDVKKLGKKRRKDEAQPAFQDIAAEHHEDPREYYESSHPNQSLEERAFAA